jgi:dihydropteroate synthase
VRIAGGLACASRFALLVREAGRSRRGGSLAQALPEAIAMLPDALAVEAGAQWAALRKVHAPIGCGERVLRMDQPGSWAFSTSRPTAFPMAGVPRQARCGHRPCRRDAGGGRGVIDVGGESTRPGAAAVWEGDEIKRVVPVIERLSAMGAAISIDSRRSSVIAAALAAGAHIVNDVSALRHDPRSMEIVAASGAPVVLMHAPGGADDLHADGHYTDVVLDVFDDLRARRDAAWPPGSRARRSCSIPASALARRWPTTSR